MIQTAAITRAAALSPAAAMPEGDPAAFGRSLAAMLDRPGRATAATGKPLPPTGAPDAVQRSHAADRRDASKRAIAADSTAAATTGEDADRSVDDPPSKAAADDDDDAPDAAAAPAASPAIAAPPAVAPPAPPRDDMDGAIPPEPAHGAGVSIAEPQYASTPPAHPAEPQPATEGSLQPDGQPSPGMPSESAARTGRDPARASAPVIPAAPAAPSGAQAPMIAIGATAPAFQLFADAIHAARRDERPGDPLASPPLAAIDPTRAAPPVAAPGGAALNMTDHRWPHAMVDRIEALRDAAGAAADAADTSIRLVPASLGRIDVSMRRDGDTVHVHFAAEQAATRTLLTDAQPRLAELAEARGLKLGQASVGAGTDQSAQRQATPQPARIAPTPAPAKREDEPELATTRIA